MAKQKFYVVWNGVKPGIYDNWTDCQLQIKGFVGAVYKSFDSREKAENAYSDAPENYIGKTAPAFDIENAPYNVESIAVDAACSGNPGKMEYRGVYVKNGTEIFHLGPLNEGTNNIGEFLAIVHALALLKKKNVNIQIYSDSINAIKWIRLKKCCTKLVENEVNKPIFELIRRAEKWLRENTFSTEIIKWDTENWGEIPADFGRK